MSEQRENLKMELANGVPALLRRVAASLEARAKELRLCADHCGDPGFNDARVLGGVEGVSFAGLMENPCGGVSGNPSQVD